MNQHKPAYLLRLLSFATIAALTLPCSAGEIYKCRDQKGKLSFSDQPCPKHAEESVLNQSGSGSAWLDRLRAESLPAIRIDNIARTEDITEIEYRFKSNSASTAFIRRAEALSNMSVKLAEHKAPANGRSGYIKLEIFSEEPALIAEKQHAE